MRNVFAIALTTYRESVRSKILYSALGFAVVLVSLSIFLGSVTIGDQVKIIKDFGLFAISFFAVGFVVLSGSSLLAKELHRKTIYNILGKAVYRWQFLLGKHLGLTATACVLVFLMNFGLMGLVYCFEGEVDFLLLVASLYVILEVFIVTSAVIFFSSLVVTPVLSAMFSLALFLAGRSIEYVRMLLEIIQGDRIGEAVLQTIYWIIPHLDQLTISNRVVYGQGVTISHFLTAILYTLGYSLVMMTVASLAFQRRDFN